MKDKIRSIAEDVNEEYKIYKEGQCRKLATKL